MQEWKKVLVQLQEETDMGVLEELLSDQKMEQKSTRDHIVKVVDLGQRQNVQTKFRLVKGGPHGNCKARLTNKEGNLPHRKPPPPTWTDPTPVKAAPSRARNT